MQLELVGIVAALMVGVVAVAVAPSLSRSVFGADYELQRGTVVWAAVSVTLAVVGTFFQDGLTALRADTLQVASFAPSAVISVVGSAVVLRGHPTATAAMVIVGAAVTAQAVILAAATTSAARRSLHAAPQSPRANRLGREFRSTAIVLVGASVLGILIPVIDLRKALGVAGICSVPLSQVHAAVRRRRVEIVEIIAVAVWAYALPAMVGAITKSAELPASILALIASPLVVALALEMVEHNKRAATTTESITRSSGIYASWGFACAAVGFVLYGSFLAVSWGGTRESLYAAESSGLGALSIGTHFVLTGLAVVAIARPNFGRVSAALLIGYVIMNAYIGERGQLLAIAALAVVLRPPASRRVVHLVLIAAVPCVVLMGSLRAGNATPASDEPFLAGTEFSVPLTVMRDLNETPDSSLDAPSIVNRLRTLIPRASSARSGGSSLPEWYTQRFYPATAATGGGRGFSIFGEALLYGGSAVVVFVPLILVTAAAILQRMFLQARHPLSKAAAALTIPWLVTMLRSDSISVAKLYMLGVLAPLAAVYVAVELVTRGRKRPTTPRYVTRPVGSASGLPS